jgi:hypothetical protein
VPSERSSATRSDAAARARGDASAFAIVKSDIGSMGAASFAAGTRGALAWHAPSADIPSSITNPARVIVAG